MSNTGLAEFLHGQQDRFLELDNANGNILSFKQECLFARQLIQKNGFSLKIASSNKASLAQSIQNVAAIGISLNPAMAHAYLVPRDGAICLDISYKGLIKIATDTGSILWAKADLVYKNDSFIYKGPATAPDHQADIFGDDRGEIVGGYCIAKTCEGDYLVEAMSIKEIHEVRNTSKAFTSGKKCPWKDWFNEMAKKTLIKRAAKTWPHTDKRQRFDSAIHVINEHEGLKEDFTQEQKDEFMLMIGSSNATGMFSFSQKHKEDGIYFALYNDFPKGEKVKNKTICGELESEGAKILQDYSHQLKEATREGHTDVITEIVGDLTADEQEALKPMLDNETESYIKELMSS